MSAAYTVFWQPGCTSCLRAKEFLTSHGIDFESINVREVDDAMERLTALVTRSVPVVARGNDFVFAQDIDTLAAFVGVELNRRMLAPDVLVNQLDRILAAAQRYIEQLPANALSTKLPARDRTYLDLGYHLFVIPIAFLDAVAGGELTYEHFERVPPSGSTAKEVTALGSDVRSRLQTWWSEVAQVGLPDSVQTYYGQQATHGVLERTAWHCIGRIETGIDLPAMPISMATRTA